MQVHGIGSWNSAFSAVTLTAALTNVALIVFTLGWLDELSPAGRQLLLCTIALVWLAQPRLPEDVATHLAAAVLAQERALLDMAAPLARKLRERHTSVVRLQLRARGPRPGARPGSPSCTRPRRPRSSARRASGGGSH
ncbi:hypothetical protein T492DRAFT_311641 [Pavlovales sp. CCMP2436]|nr:hypothetical protein T492DRAFT_311641 [Pavlovales sp. CCMP2436]